MRKRKGRGDSPNTSQKVINAICYVKAQHNGKKYSANQVRNYLIDHREELMLTVEHIPLTRTIENIISNNTDKIQSIKSRIKDNPLDEPWTLAACSQYPSLFSPELFPFVLACKQRMSLLVKDTEAETEHRKVYGGQSIADFTIRHAAWIIRLQPLIRKLFPDIMEIDDELTLYCSVMIPLAYSTSESISELLGDKRFDTTALDEALFNRDLPSFIRTTHSTVSRKPINCPTNCESCKYHKQPETDVCIPKRKEVIK